jgi:hypothetical protein
MNGIHRKRTRRCLTDEAGGERHVPLVPRDVPGKTALFLSFPYVCPEPVLVK